MRLLTILFYFLLAAAAQAEEHVSLELVLLADSTGSIDTQEIIYQRQGYATGISHPAVVDAIMNTETGRIAVIYVEWGDSRSQEVIAPWTIIASQQDADEFAARILSETGRRARGRNAIGAALLRGRQFIQENDIESTRQVIDMSSDSANNRNATSITRARDRIVADGITINGLPIPCRHCVRRSDASARLERHYREQIIGGPGAFVVTVDDMIDFAAAVRRKLVLEISGTMPERRYAAGAPTGN